MIGIDKKPPSESAISRRGFLKAAGFSVAGAVATACERAPIEKAIPYLIQPEEIIPGRAYHYASTCGGCPAGCGLLVKNRDGRPIKLEGNPDHPISRGGLCAVGQAAILGLYDSHRLRHPLQQGQQSDWGDVDTAVSKQLATLRENGGAVRLLTGNVTSPTGRRVIARFLEPFADARHVTYEPLSSSAIVDAHQRTHGAAVLPRFHFAKADVIVGFDADFLGTWISPVEFTAGYRAGRTLESESPRFSRHIQFESRMSVTGSKADRRILIQPGDVGLLMSHLAKRLAGRAGVTFAAGNLGSAPVPAAVLDDVADYLWRARGRSLVLCGLQDVKIQVLANFINHVLGNYESTVDLARPSYQRRGTDGGFADLLRELNEGSVKALFVDASNPVYTLPSGRTIAEAIQRVPLVVSFAGRLNETSRLAHYVCPDHHFLEAWADAEPVHGVVSYSQPAIRPLGQTRAWMESLAAWSGQTRSARDLLRETLPDRSSWNRAVHDGYAEVGRDPVSVESFRLSVVEPVRKAREVPGDAFALVLYPKVAMHDGRHAYNPWLQELPDPITKVVWDNYASLSPATADRLGVKRGDVVRITLPGVTEDAPQIELPVLVQRGQHDQVVAVALGYGSEETERFDQTGPRWLHARPTVGPNGRVGISAAPLLGLTDGTLRYSGRTVTLEPTGRKHTLVASQKYDSLSVPEHLSSGGEKHPRAVYESTLAAALAAHASTEEDHGHGEEHANLWPDDHKYEGHHWGMAIDLTACTGCSACVVSCQIENNIPVVGKDEVDRSRLMHWLRIDRYYAERDGGVDVAHQPMLCHHCDNAPCETVCPVLATIHSSEGLNQQVYNRCVGTRYCSNNCPYKVRRFNWFDYPHDDILYDLVLNPDVTVRSRGIMEKCTFCIQRIQEAKIEARRQGRNAGIAAPLVVQPACQQSCPADAIAFGDMNDPESAVSKLIRSRRHYRLLEEINVKPSVGYLKLVRNRTTEEHHG